MTRTLKLLIVPVAVVVAAVSGAAALEHSSSPDRGAALTAQGKQVTPPGLIWEGLASEGTKVFQGLEEAPGTIGVANDPTGVYGPSFRYETWLNPKKGIK